MLFFTFFVTSYIHGLSQPLPFNSFLCLTFLIYSATERDGGQLQSKISWCAMYWVVWACLFAPFCVCALFGIHITVVFPEFMFAFCVLMLALRLR